MTKLGSRKLHILQKVTKMRSIIGNRIDYNVGSCCVRVGSGVQTDATTPNNVGPTM